MSSRARLATGAVVIAPFDWQTQAESLGATTAGDARNAAALDPQHLAALERDAFAKGFAQGERAGGEAAAQRGEAMLRRLAQTLEEVTQLRTRMIRETEQQMVQLALAVARRIVHREISLDQDLLMAIARVAMDRLGESARVTIRLNPDDFAACAAGREHDWAGSHVTPVSDARVPRGGCRIESDFGAVDAGVDAQLHELAQALLNESRVHVER
jgi:flagellar assembly protein FliH